MYNEEKSFADARTDCIKRGGDLASIRNADEFALVKKAIGPNSPKEWKKYWFGLMPLNIVEKKWVWTDGSAFTGFNELYTRSLARVGTEK